MEPIEIKHALLKVGISVEGIWDLVNTQNSYPEAIPVLVEFLQANDLDDVSKEGIIRALAVKEAKGKKIGRLLIDEFNKIAKEKHGFRWAVGSTMSVIISAEDLEEVLEIVRNKENGTARQMFVFSLGKMKLKQVEDILIDLLDDDDVVLHAISSLKKLKSFKALSKMQKLLQHPHATIRKRAKIYTDKFGSVT